MIDRRHFQDGALIVGAAGLFVLLAAVFFDPMHALRAYLYAWLACLGISLGSMSILMMQYLTGGRWGMLIRRLAEAAAMTLPLLAILFIPIALGARSLFPWAQSAAIESSAILRHRQVAFTLPLVLVRCAIYFAIWIFWAWRLRTLSLDYDVDLNPRRLVRLRRYSAAGLVIYFATMSLAAVDWIASREVDWYSSTFGLAVVVGQAVAGVAFLILIIALVRPNASHELLHDLGNLLLTVVVLWAYIEFAQFLVIWAGNMQEDITWFYHRTHRGWGWIGMALILLHFAVPFAFLLFQDSKRSIRRLAWIAGGVLVMRVVHLLWMIAPSSMSEIPHSVQWLDLIAPLGVGGIWFAMYLWILNRHAIVPAELGLDERADEQPAVA
jgi:hypothetical protein